MQRILIVGFGNPHRGDDGFGYRVAEQLQAMNQDPVVEVVATQELMPELAEFLSRVDLVLFLDACTKTAPGGVRLSELTPDEKVDGVFSHDLTPGTLLAAARLLYRRCPQAMMLSVGCENFDISARLSPKVEAALPQVFERIKEVIASAKSREPALRVR